MQAQLAPRRRRRAPRLLSLSFDLEHDRRDELAAYAKLHGADARSGPSPHRSPRRTRPAADAARRRRRRGRLRWLRAQRLDPRRRWARHGARRVRCRALAGGPRRGAPRGRGRVVSRVHRSTLWLAALLPLALLHDGLRHAIESRMALHMLVEFPLLLASGWAIARLAARHVPTDAFDALGLLGVAVVSCVSAFWMIPAALDLALLHEPMRSAKLASWIAPAPCWRAAGRGSATRSPSSSSATSPGCSPPPGCSIARPRAGSASATSPRISCGRATDWSCWRSRSAPWRCAASSRRAPGSHHPELQLRRLAHHRRSQGGS